jgi:uncharacterized protein
MKDLFQPSFMIVPSLACPAACRYCFGPHEGKTMTSAVASSAVEFIDRIMRETGQAKLRLTLHGGEPLMAGHDLFEELFLKIEQVFAGQKRKLAIQSNLWLLDERFCGILKRYHVSVGTSLDGPMEINDAQRGPGSYTRTMAGIHKARSAGLAVSCIATFTRTNARQWQEVFDFFRDNDLGFSLHPAVASLQGKSGLEIAPEKWRTMLRDMFARYARERHVLRIETLDQFCRAIVEQEGSVCSSRDCFGMFLVIDPDGGIYPCQRMAGSEQFRMGSIFELPSMEDLVKSPPARLLRDREERMNRVCGDCRHLALCRGGCPYNAITGGDGDKDPLCEAYKDIYDEVHKRLLDEIESPGNITLLAERGLRSTGHPLAHSGVVAELSRRDGHPSQTVYNARRVVAAVELARDPDLEKVSSRLVESGISRNKETALASLERMKASIGRQGNIYKLYLHTTFRCQLHCTHCYSKAGEDDDEYEMPPEVISRLAVEGAALGFQEVVITGGEPLFHRESPHVLKRLKESRRLLGNTKLVLRTNLSLPLSTEDMDTLAATFDQVAASMDGTPDLHDTRRGAGSFALLHQNLKRWVTRFGTNGHQKDVLAELTLAASLRSKDAHGEVGRKTRAFAEILGIHRVKMRPLLPLGRARDWKEPPTTEALHMNIEPWEVLEQGFAPCMSCGIGQNVYVEPDGTAFPCYAYHQPHSLLGNVNNESLVTILNSTAFKHLAGRTVDTNRRCRYCDMRYICGGACRAWSSDTAQFDLDAPPENCLPLREKAERLYQEALAYLGTARNGFES